MGMDEDDQRLWEIFVKGIKPLSHDKKPPAGFDCAAKIRRLRRSSEQGVIAPHAGKIKSPAQDRDSRQIDKRTLERLKGGALTIEARIDLHGYTLGEAQAELTRKLISHYAHSRRLILVITGQGIKNKKENNDQWWETQRGRLRSEVPEWLSRPPLSDIVLQFHTAKQKDGGAGALYVLLRRKKPERT